jgi:hypothetical protein
MPYVKLDCGILNSTLWFERDAREVFITALLMAEPFELREPTPQIYADSLDYTGWSVPAGWYGFVPAAGIGIIHRARVDETSGRAALVLLGSPEISSRSPEFDGRRLVRIDGGYIVLNFIKYREKDATTAERSRRWRERQKQKMTQPETGDTRDSNTDTRDTTLKQKQKQKHIQKQKQEGPIPSSASADSRLPFADFWDVWPTAHRVGRKQAEAQWQRLSDADRLTAIEAVGWRVIHDRAWCGPAEDGKWAIPHPFRYLRDRRFTDAQTTAPPGGRKIAEQAPAYAPDWCDHEPRCCSRDWHEVLVGRTAGQQERT